LNGAIFDWDGTLAHIDDREFYCINQTLKAHGSKTIDRKFYIKNFYQRAYETGTGPRMVLETALSSEDGVSVEQAYETYTKLFRENVDKTELQKGALEILAELRQRGFRLGIATMRNVRSVVAKELDLLKVSPFVDTLLTREDLGPARGFDSLEETIQKRAQLATRTLNQLRLRVQDAFLVGDSWWDVRAGKNLGIRTVLVRTGFSLYNNFSSENPDVTVDSLDQLLVRLERNGWTL
jgi:phosphoglycolate phosphatase-like HAD superfamily hydrolase